MAEKCEILINILPKSQKLDKPQGRIFVWYLSVCQCVLNTCKQMENLSNFISRYKSFVIDCDNEEVHVLFVVSMSIKFHLKEI